MPRLAALLVGALALGSCDENPPPGPAKLPDPVVAATGFQFEPTLDAHRPPGSSANLVAEVGDAATGNLSLVLAYHNGTTLSLSAWRFSSTGEDETLMPVGAPTPLLALRPGEATDGETLSALIRTRAAAHTVGGRPQGIDASDAVGTLRTLHRYTTIIRNPKAPPASRTEALAAFTRGLDDALLFSRSGLFDVLDVLAIQQADSAPEGSGRRVSLSWGNTVVSMLRKSDGWVINALQLPPGI